MVTSANKYNYKLQVTTRLGIYYMNYIHRNAVCMYIICDDIPIVGIYLFAVSIV